MKEINLPVTTTYSFTVDTHAISAANVQEIDGKQIISLGTMDFGEKGREIEIVRSNGGKILYATTSIEQKLEQIISYYIFGLFLRQNPGRSFFENEILGSSVANFSFKKELLKKLVNESEILTGKKKHELERQLSEIMKWRNAFAHGKVQYDNAQGYFLKYYSNGHKKIVLEDAFWDDVIQTFGECEKTLSEVQNAIEKPHWEQMRKSLGKTI